MKRIIVLLFTLFSQGLTAQVVYEHVSKNTIYEFLDEMATMKVVEINTAIKPYTREFIAQKLKEIKENESKLNKRQKGELKFFLRDYTKELGPDDQWDVIGRKVIGKNRVKFKERAKRVDMFYYKDTNFNITVNPILGMKAWNTESGLVTHTFGGAEAFAYAGKHLGIYANLRDNQLSTSMLGASYLVQGTGGRFKGASVGTENRNAREFSEMRGGITYAWKWGHIGLIKEHNVWGNNYNGANILSNRAPSFAQVKLNLKPAKWIEFNYFHGWLSSMVIDSSRSQNYGNGPAQNYVPKFLAMNMFTLKPLKGLYLNVGNSMIYSQSFNAGYMIPFIFYKSLDHTYNSLGNAAMFFDVSIRSLKKVHFYFTGYLDELSIGRMFNKQTHSNFWSGKAGVRVNNVIPNTVVTAEYTRTNPITYKHYNPETTFENTGYNFGHYLRDNAQDIYLSITYKPLPRLHVSAFFNQANKGPDYPDDRVTKNPNTGKTYVLGLPFQESLIWESTTLGGSVNYEVLNDVHIRLAANYTNVWDPTKLYTPEVFSGKQVSIAATLCWGF